MLRLLAERQTETNLRLLQRDEEAEGRGTGGKIFTVYSTKGGAGKTTVAVNLAVTLAQQYPEQVALLDLSLTFGHAAMFLDLQPRASLSAMSVEVLAKFDREALMNYMVTHASTLRVLPGAVRPEEGEGVSQEHVQTVLGLLKRFFGYVVVDASSTFTDTTLAALENSDKVIFILTPELDHRSRPGGVPANLHGRGADPGRPLLLSAEPPLRVQSAGPGRFRASLRPPGDLASCRTAARLPYRPLLAGRPSPRRSLRRRSPAPWIISLAN